MAKKTMKTAAAQAVRVEMPTAEVLRAALAEQFGPAAAMIAQHEGLRLKAYVDRAANGEDKGVAVGVGRNLTHRGLSQQEALLLFYNDLVDWTARIEVDVPEYTALDPVRRAVLLDMAHTASTVGVKRFKMMRAALASKDWRRAALEMGDSLWYEQQPTARSSRLVTMMLSGRAEGDWTELDVAQRDALTVTKRHAFRASLGRARGDAVVIAAEYQAAKPRRKRTQRA